MTLTTELAPATTGVELPPSPPAPRPAWLRPAPLGLGVVVFLLCVAWTNRVVFVAGTPRSAVLLVTIGPGLLALGVLLRRADRAAMAAIGFLVVATLSTLLAREPLLALFGEYSSRTGLLFLVACLGLWALGRCDPGPVAPVVAGAILAGACVNAAIGWLQASTDLGIQGLALYGGRAAGLMGNPVFLAGLCAGAVWIALDWARKSTRPLVPLLVTGFLVGAVQLSGGRSGLLAVLVGGVWFIGVHLRARRPWLAAGVLAAIVLGVLASFVPSAASSSASERVQSSASDGIAPRAAVWTAGIRSLEDDPLLGSGPGRFVVASTPRRSLVSVRYEGRDVLLGDAHNVFVEILTTTGALGLLAFSTWLVLAGRRARGALAGFAALVLITMLLEPLDLGLTPLVALALGAATIPGDHVPFSIPARRWILVAGGILAVVGAVLGARLVTGDVAFADAVTHGSLSDVRTAEHLSPPWPQYPALRAQLLDVRAKATNDRALGLEAIAAERAAIARNPSDPKWHSSLGALEETWGTPAAARRQDEAALARNPWSYLALTHLYGVELRAKDRAAALRVRARLCEIGPSECPPTPEVIARAQRNQAKAAADPRASTP